LIVLKSVSLSSALQEISGMLSRKRRLPVKRSDGVRWAILAAFAFGAMDFSIGLSANISGWFSLALLFWLCILPEEVVGRGLYGLLSTYSQDESSQK
jgi:hypothetical protein